MQSGQKKEKDIVSVRRHIHEPGSSSKTTVPNTLL
jgi:hypothetical protein